MKNLIETIMESFNLLFGNLNFEQFQKKSSYQGDFIDIEPDDETDKKQKKKFNLLPILLIVFVLFVSAQCTYTVGQTEHALKFRFDKIVEVNVNNLTEEEYDTLVQDPDYANIKLTSGAGLHFKFPFVDRIEKYDNRLITYDTMPREVITLDKKIMILDNNAQWWIVDPVKFKITMNSINSANQRIEDLMYSKINERVGLTLASTLISDKEYVIAMLEEKAVELNSVLAQYGIKVADIQIKRTDLPDSNNENIFNRMRTEREQMARQYRSEGLEEAEKIRAEADMEAAKIRAEANAEAQRIRGEGDAIAAEIYNEAYNADPAFYAFYQTLDAYKKILPESGAKIVISPDSDFAKFLYGIE